MSYCRLSDDSDVYMFGHVAGHIECCGCSVIPRRAVMYNGMQLAEAINYNRRTKITPKTRMCWTKRAIVLHSAADALEHLQAHIDAGDRVPQYAFDSLREEL